ncbi:MAG: AsmA family protein, partial [Thermodesulfobacteriota bacterium]|nr:AsmA family protein [Thermodesulfobacteriota bacterium]
MGRQKKMWAWVAGVLGALFMLLIVASLAVPRLVNLSPVKEKILADVSQAVGGDVGCEGVALSLLPRPKVLVHHGTITIPGKLVGSVGSLAIYPSILPLLQADVRLSKLLLESPAVTVTIPKGLTEGKGREEGASPATPEQKLAPLLEAVSSSAPGLVVHVKNGALNLFQDEKALFSLGRIDA